MFCDNDKVEWLKSLDFIFLSSCGFIDKDFAQKGKFLRCSFQFSFKLFVKMKLFLIVFALSGFVLVQSSFDCKTPDCTINSNRPTLWPHDDPINFYRCELDAAKLLWAPVVGNCQCGNVFSFIGQRCTIPSKWTKVCTIHPDNPVAKPCTR